MFHDPINEASNRLLVRINLNRVVHIKVMGLLSPYSFLLYQKRPETHFTIDIYDQTTDLGLNL